MLRVVSYLCILLTLLLHPGSSKRLLNVLFLVSDDLRTELGAWVDPQWPEINPRIHTPSLDSLASHSLVLRRAYVQQAVCNPSRTSTLTGRRPDTTRVHDCTHYWREVGGNFTTIPQYYKQHGYRTAGLGKVFHPGSASGGDDPISWTEPYFRPSNGKWGNYYNHTAWYAADVSRTEKYPLVDQQIAARARHMLKEFALKARTGEQPFLLAVGFKKPHLPWLFPANYLDLYPVENISLPTHPHAPIDMPETAWANFPGLRHYSDFTGRYGHGGLNETFIPDPMVRELRRAYYATVSYIDDMVGRVVSGLQEEGLDNNTVIVFWGDHGWQLGEHGEWEKHTNFELATHAPLMFSIPGVTDKGVVTDALTEFVDIFPTLAEATGLPVPPACPNVSTGVELCTEGLSALPLVTRPSRKWKSGAFSQYPRLRPSGDLVMGYTLRTHRYRYTHWGSYDDQVSVHSPGAPWWAKTYGNELYDHQVDPWENVNRAKHPGYKGVVKELEAALEAGWRAALPQPLSP